MARPSRPRTRGLRPLAVVLTGLLALLGVLASSPPAAAQATGNATLRGTVFDSSGGVLPGATVTVVSADTRAAQTVVTDERGGYLFSGLFPGTYDLRVTLAGFKTAEQTGLILSPDDTRGVDVALLVGEQAEHVTVRANNEVIQTETGAREGVLTAPQIDHLSIMGRSALELLRILPGVVAPDHTAFESVSFTSGANDSGAYTVNGIRSSNNTVSLDGSALIDIGGNVSTMVTLNTDMVQEVKVQSSNFAAEYGSGAVNISAVTKSGSSKFSGTVYDYYRDYRLAATDRSYTILGQPKRKSTFNYPGGNLGGPILIPGWDYTRTRDKLFFFLGLEAQRQTIDNGAFLTVVPTERQRAGDFSEWLVEHGQNLNQPVGPVLIPQGFPGAGTPSPGNNLAPYITRMGQVLTNLYPLPNYVDPENRYNYFNAVLTPTNRLDMKTRVDWNVTANTKAYVRIARETEDVEGANGAWWGASQVPLPSPNLGTNRGRSIAGNLVTVLSPTMTNEALVSWSQLKLDNAFKDPSKMTLAGNGLTDFVPSFPGESPYIPGVYLVDPLANLAGWAFEVYQHNDELTFSDKLTKIAGAHAMKFGLSVQRLQKQMNFQNNEEGYMLFGPSWMGVPGSTGNDVGDLLTGRISNWQQGTRVPDGEYRMWNVDAFAQDAWKLRPNLTLEVGVRAGYWPNNVERNGLGGWFDRTQYDPSKPQFLDPGTFRVLNGVCYVATGCARPGILDNRSPFAIPRVNVAWDLDGTGKNVLRGGYGLFYNRNMGNVEYDNTLRLPPATYSIWQDAWGGAGYGNGRGLTYDTVREATLATRLGGVSIITLTPDSFAFPKTHSFSVSFARRLFFNQVLEASYVGTRGRSLISHLNGNPVPEGSLLSGTLGNADLSIPVNRVALDPSAVNTRRPLGAYPGLTVYDFEGESDYNALQVTLSRQTGKRLQYFAAYTLGRATGTISSDYYARDPFDPSRTYGVLRSDRRHIFNLSWNAFLPDGARGWLDRPVWRGVLNGWQLSGISTFSSGTPIWLGFWGPAGDPGVPQAFFGTPDGVNSYWAEFAPSSGLAPVYTCDPRLPGTKVGEKILDLACIGFPAFGQNGDVLPPYDLRTPSRQNHDLTLFKNFAIHGEQKLQFRVGFFNLFNTAYATDIRYELQTECNSYVDHVPNGLDGYVDHVCDPTAGFHYIDDTIQNFGKITLKRGRRVIELAVKYYF